MENTRCVISNELHNSSPQIRSCRFIKIVRQSYTENYFN